MVFDFISSWTMTLHCLHGYVRSNCVRRAGEVISATQVHAAPAQSRISVDVASNGANTLVVWSQSASYDETAGRPRLRHSNLRTVSADLAILGDRWRMSRGQMSLLKKPNSPVVTCTAPA